MGIRTNKFTLCLYGTKSLVHLSSVGHRVWLESAIVLEVNRDAGRAEGARR